MTAIAEFIRGLRREEAGGWRRVVEHDAITGDPEFVRWVREVYSRHPLLDVGGHAFPCALFETPADQAGDPDSVVRWDPLAGEVGPRIGVPEYLGLLTDHARRDRVELFDGPIAAMVTIDTAEKLTMTCRRGGYFAAVESCDALKLEAQRAWTRKANPEVRQQLHRRVLDPVRCGHHRCAAAAVSTAVCVRTAEGWRWLLRRTAASKTAVESGRFHVVPAGMMEPPRDGGGEVSVTQNVMRELEEELAGEEGVAELRGLLRSGRAWLLLGGIAVNLLNLRPEVCTVLVVEDPSWWASVKRRGPGCGEYEGEVQEFAAEKGNPAAKLGSGGVAIAAAAALELGERALRRVV